jgi:deoxyribonuclease V
MTPREAADIQRKLQSRVSCRPVISLSKVRLVAGADVSYARRATDGHAAIVVCTYPGLEVVEIASASGIINFPYVPGLLTFRELPLLEEAWGKLNHRPDILVCDGQGRAHPRRIGLASHVGLALDVPTVGCAKSRLTGTYNEPPAERGSATPLYDEREIIGRVVRTRDYVKPLFVSVGHKVSLRQAVRLVLNLCRKYRQPEVIRYAHNEVNRIRREANSKRTL